MDTDYNFLLHFWMYFNPQTMPVRLPSGLCWDVWSMQPLFEIRNLTEDTMSLEYYSCNMKKSYYSKENGGVLTWFFPRAQKGSYLEGFWTASNIFIRPYNMLTEATNGDIAQVNRRYPITGNIMGQSLTHQILKSYYKKCKPFWLYWVKYITKMNFTHFSF